MGCGRDHRRLDALTRPAFTALFSVLARVCLGVCLGACLGGLYAGCKGFRSWVTERARELSGEDESEEEEEREAQMDNFWRAQISIQGQGRVKTFIDAFDCVSDGVNQTGICGPKLVRFKEMKPATMQALPAPGWRFDHWDAHMLEPDGAVIPRKGPMPDGKVYLNGFGYADTGELETVIAVFVPEGGAGAEAGK